MPRILMQPDGTPKRWRLLFDKKPVSVINISPVIGAHAGVGAAAVAFMYE